jgi:hypothetical protein
VRVASCSVHIVDLICYGESLFIKDLLDIRIIRPFKQTIWSDNMISTLRKFEEGLFLESALTGSFGLFSGYRPVVSHTC